MLKILYPSILSFSSALSLAEKSCNYSFFTERHMQALWLEQKYFAPLLTVCEKKVRVISPGIWNAEAGPDFLKAHLQIDGQEVRGDVELHLSAESWYSHHHHQDARYNNVVLHLAFWPSKSEKKIEKENGCSVPHVDLEQFLTIPESRILKLLDLDLYPYKKFLGSGKCAQEIFYKMNEKEISSFFQEAAFWRLLKKSNHLKSAATDDLPPLSLGIATALGYKHNSHVFVELFKKMMEKRSWDEWTLFAYCLGACGFFHEVYQKKWCDSEFYQCLSRRFATFPSELAPVQNLNIHSARPYNHPIRRLAYLVKFIKDQNTPYLYTMMLNAWKSYWHRDLSLNNLYQQFISFLPEYKDFYWNRHFIFEPTPKEKFLPLLGNDIKKQILINAFFPLLYAEICKQADEKELNVFISFYSSIPASDSGKSKYLSHRFFGDRHLGKVFNKAEMQQGAFQLHYDFCTHYEASCQGCPFIKNYRENFHK